MYRIRSAAWVWHFLEKEDWNFLGPRPEEQTPDTVLVKSGAVRGVFRRDGYYFKVEMPDCRNPLIFWREVLYPRAAREFWRLFRLQQKGIPVTEPVGFGQALTVSLLITREWKNGVAAGDFWQREFVRGNGDPAAFLTAWSCFFRRLYDSGFVHHDLHNGNLLYRPEDQSFALVDVCDVRKRHWWSSRRKMHGILGEFADRLNRAEMCRLLTDCGLTTPENADTFRRELLAERGRFAARHRQKRRKQLFANYAKFVQEIDGVIYSLDAARDPLITPEELAQCVRLELPEEDAARIREEDLYLTLLRIPHRRVAAFHAPGILYLEPVSGTVAPEEQEELLERLTLAGCAAENWDFVRDRWNRPQIAWRI